MDTEERAVEILEHVKISAESEFRSLARENSKGVEAPKGGELGVFEIGQLPSEMEKIVFTMNEGDISPVVGSLYGYHIFRLDKKFGP